MNLQNFLYGGDYNPNQWERDIWKEDMRIFKKASINSATINVFSWAKLQPSEDIYDFRELDDIIAMLAKENYNIVLATSTAALPAWMFKKYPEVGRVDFQGRRHRFGQRHNACPNSLVHQTYVSRLVEQLAKRYGNHPNIVIWHVNNEYGGTCYCENCEKAFRSWLKQKYQTITKLNQAWNMEFWGHTVYDWDEIVVPNVLGDAINERDTAFAGLSLDYCRFQSDRLLDNFRLEKRIIRKYDRSTPITTNLMGTYKQLDYFKWAKEMDIISWDNYPAYDTPVSFTAMSHDLMRGLKSQPFMLMEQTPSQQNWQPYNSLKKPGQLRAQSYQTIAHGADTIQYFQLRRSIGGCEKFHGGVIEHVGHEHTRVFQEVAQLGAELQTFGNAILGAQHKAQVGIVFDWDTYWALEYTSGPHKDITYVEQIHQYYHYFYEQNMAIDIIPYDADFSKYSVIVAPVLYMLKDNMAQALETYVEQGGILVITYLSGLVDANDTVFLGGYPGPLSKLAGIWVEEIDALAPGQINHIVFQDGVKGTTSLVSDLIHLTTAQGLGYYTSNFYKNMPFATHNHYGKGHTFYIGAQVDKASLAKIMQQVCAQGNVQPLLQENTALEISYREKAGIGYYFLINFTQEEQPIPKCFIKERNILNQEVLTVDTFMMPYDVIIIKRLMHCK